MKLPANASKEWSGTFKDLEKKRDKLKGKLRQVMAEHIHEDGLGGPEAEKGRKQRQRLEHQVERLSEFLQEQQPRIGKGRREIQGNGTDNQSAKMPTSHGVIQGHNAQALVDEKHQILVHAEAFRSQDHENLAPVMTGAKRNKRAVAKGRTISKVDSSAQTAIITAWPTWPCARRRSADGQAKSRLVRRASPPRQV